MKTIHQFLLLSLPLLLNSNFLPAQATLSGTVIEANTNEPVPFATVYFDGTTNGQTTDEQGGFSLDLADISLPASLVVSHVGYEPWSTTIRQATGSLQVKLRPRVQMVATVTVQDQNQREKNLEEFRRTFLGADEWGQRARILNEEVLIFERDYVREKLATTTPYMRNLIRQSGRDDGEWAADGSYYEFDKARTFQVSAGAPLKIELPDLGYQLQVDLVSFTVDYEQGQTAYYGYYFFQPEEPNSPKLSERYRKKRQNAFFNSTQHFLRSLFAGKLSENGYQTLEATSNDIGRRQSVRPFEPAPHLQQTANGQMEIVGLKDKKLLILYYGDRRGRPQPEAKWKRTQPVQSGLYIGADSCLIREDGTVGESQLFFSGNMGNRGIAWLLPSDYHAAE